MQSAHFRLVGPCEHFMGTVSAGRVVAHFSKKLYGTRSDFGTAHLFPEAVFFGLPQHLSVARKSSVHLDRGNLSTQE